MIDVGGPSMLRGAAKNFAHCAPVCRPERYGFVLDELRRERRALARDEERARRRGVRDDGRVRGGDRDVVRGARAVPGDARPRPREGARPLVRREPAPARRVLRRARRPRASALARRAAARQGALVQQPQRPLGGASPRARVHAARLRDRQARESVRRRHRRDDRGGVRQGARIRPGVGVRRHRRAQPRGRGRARREARGAVRRGAVRARIRRRARSRRSAASRTRASSSTASGVAPARRAGD